MQIETPSTSLTPYVKSITGHTLLSGQQKEYYDIRISGRLSLFSIIFQPHGLMVFFDIPLDPGLNLTELSYQAVYYDQSHMNAEFQRLAGMTPGQYFEYCEPYSDYFS